MTTISELAQQFKKFQEQFSEPVQTFLDEGIEKLLAQGSKFEDLYLLVPMSIKPQIDAIVGPNPSLLDKFDRIRTRWGYVFIDFDQYIQPDQMWLIDITKFHWPSSFLPVDVTV